jgi:tetratricopeptide (TPR) repeat protein
MAAIQRGARRAIFVLLMVLAASASRAGSTAGQDTPQSTVAGRDPFEALTTGRIREATLLFAGAIAAAPRDPDLRVGAALAAYLDGRYDDAKRMLDAALALDAKHLQARLLLGRVQRRTGDSQGAVRTYDALKAALPNDTSIADLLARWRREDDLHSRMDQSVGVHFSVAFEGREESALAERAVAALERAYDRIGDVLVVYPVTPILVVLYTQQQFRDITRSPSWADGAYDGTIRVPVRGALNQERELERLLAHEFTHALIASMTTRRLPTWFNEGLAGALEMEDVGWADGIVRQLPEPVPLEALTGSFRDLSGDQAAAAYAVSALAVHRLIENAGGVAIANLLRDLDDGVSFEASFAHRMQRTLKEFEAEWDTR